MACRKIKKQGGPAADNSRKYTSNTVYRKIKRILLELKRKPLNQSTFNTASTSSVCKPLNRSTLIPPAGASCKGSILIEFAVCMPVLIILLYYINDLSKLKRYYDQTEFVAQQTVNMIQNISQRRSAEAATSEEKEELLKISKKDLLRIHALAWKTVYPGLTIFRKDSVYPLNHKPITSIYYVEGVDDGKASCFWRTWTRFYGSLSSFGFGVYTEDNPHSTVRFLTETAPENIYPALKLKKGDKKIIIETLIERSKSNNQYSNISDKAAMGLYLADPAKLKDGPWSYMFHSVVIFTPKEGLFSRTAPQ